MQTRLMVAAIVLLFLLTACTGGQLQPLPADLSPTQSEAGQPEAGQPEAPQPDGPILDESALAIQPLAATTVGLYERVELDLQTSTTVANPFDPAQIDIRVTFIAPSGNEFNSTAFWYQDFHRDTLNPIGTPGWKVRFTPNETGRWRAWANLAGEAITESGHSAEITFDVTESEAKGFVRVDPRNPRYFAFDDGTPYFAIGLNIGWVSGAPPTGYLGPYERWLTQLSENGGNVARIWMASWPLGWSGRTRGWATIPSGCSGRGCWIKSLRWPRSGMLPSSSP